MPKKRFCLHLNHDDIPTVAAERSRVNDWSETELLVIFNSLHLIIIKILILLFILI